MKIAIVTDAWHPQINGVVTTYLETIRELGRQGHDVITITPERFKTFRCPTYPEIALSLVRPATIRETLVKSSPQAIHIATEGPLGWAARRVCLNSGLPFTTSFHTRFPEYVRLRLPIPLRLSYSLIKRFHNKADCLMVSTKQLMEELIARGFENVKLWSRGVDIDLFRPRPKDRLRNDSPLFTFVGRVAPEKNLEAFLNLDLPGQKCVIGDGPAREEMSNRYPEAIFTGFKQGEKLAELIAASSVFVFPSLTDTFGLVQLEAMASGVPVAAYPVSGPRSVITNGYNGWMDEDLKTAVLKCLNIKPENCRAFALTHSWEACTKQFVDNLIFQGNSLSTRQRALQEAA